MREMERQVEEMFLRFRRLAPIDAGTGAAPGAMVPQPHNFVGKSGAWLEQWQRQMAIRKSNYNR